MISSKPSQDTSKLRRPLTVLDDVAAVMCSLTRMQPSDWKIITETNDLTTRHTWKQSQQENNQHRKWKQKTILQKKIQHEQHPVSVTPFSNIESQIHCTLNNANMTRISRCMTKQFSPKIILTGLNLTQTQICLGFSLQAIPTSPKNMTLDINTHRHIHPVH